MNQLSGPEWLQSKEKRYTDIALSVSLAPLAGPLVVAAGATVALTDKVNPLFLQERVGLESEQFIVPKIRTLQGVSESVPSHRGYNDPRASRLGKFLRHSHIDELPQVFLVLTGKMSVVGPRPLPTADHESMLDSLGPTEQVDWLKALDIAKSGIVMAYNMKQHEKEPTEVSYYERAMEDIEYAGSANRQDDNRLVIDSILATKDSLLRCNLLK